jgi:Na+/H+-dicarboxylate symporter
MATIGSTNLLLSGKLSELAGVSRIVIICLGAAAITVAITVVRTLIVTKRSLKDLFSAQLPSLLINLTTGSQVSALPESMKCCKEKWGIDDKFTDFGLPLGIVIYMPCGAIMLGAIAWVLTYMSAGSIDPITLAKIVFVSVIVAIAAPPIPGSAFAVFPILFSASGTDLSMMPLAVIIGSTVGYLLPALNGYCLQLELLMSAQKSGCIKKDHVPEKAS